MQGLSQLSSSVERSAGRTEQAFDTEAAIASAGIAPAGNGGGALQPALDPLCPAAQTFSPIRNCTNLCSHVRKSHSFCHWKWAGYKPSCFCWCWPVNGGGGEGWLRPCSSRYCCVQAHLFQDPVVEVLGGGVDSGLLCSRTAHPPAGQANKPEVVSALVLAHKRPTAVPLQQRRKDEGVVGWPPSAQWLAPSLSWHFQSCI